MIKYAYNELCKRSDNQLRAQYGLSTNTWPTINGVVISSDQITRDVMFMKLYAQYEVMRGNNKLAIIMQTLDAVLDYLKSPHMLNLRPSMLDA
jgi:hypothetical protein